MVKAKRRLIKVTAESQLRTGMIVIVKNSRCCGMDHEYLLGNRIEDWHRHGNDDKECYSAYRWTLLSGSCHVDTVCLMNSSIPDGRLFRVEDGMDQEILEDRRRRNKERLDDLVAKVKKFKELTGSKR